MRLLCLWQAQLNLASMGLATRKMDQCVEIFTAFLVIASAKRFDDFPGVPDGSSERLVHRV